MAHSTIRRIRARLSQLRPWSALAAVVLVGGVGLSIAASTLWSRDTQGQAIRSFRAEATSVGLTVTGALRRMDDLTDSARTLLETNPNLTNGELATWYRGIGGRNSFPGALGLGYVESVPAAELPRYRAVVRADPVPGLVVPRRRLEITPPGRRSRYCLVRLSVASAIQELLPKKAGYDLCTIPGASAVFGAGAVDTVSAVSASIPRVGQVLIVSDPVYDAGGEVPPTPALRRALMMGWTVAAFNVRSVVGPLVRDHRLAVAITWRKGDAGARPLPASALGRITRVASFGHAPAHTALRQSFGLNADGNWFVTVAKAPDWGLLSPSAQGDAVLAAGLAISLLLFSFVQVLGRGRQRALRLVAEKTEELRHQALHDALTGLPNRALILDRAEQLVSRTRRDHVEPAALFLDLDDFKAVNDTFGHAAGDAILQAVAERLSATLRDADTVGRLGGDEFVVLVEARTRSVPELVAQRLLDVLREPFHPQALGSHGGLTLTASIGIASGDRPAAEDLLRDADIALYEAKGAGKYGYAVFEPKMGAHLHDRLALEIDLYHALERDELFLEYQPIFDLSRGRLVGAEALLRWRHPKRGVVPPIEFVPIAESVGLIGPIGAWVLETACAQGRLWRERGHAVNIGVNVSAVQLDDPTFADTVATALAASGLAASALVLEITESVVIRDPAGVSGRLSALKALGVRIAIDDFGTGHSSLAYLQQLPVDLLKIDRSFIEQVATSAESRAVIKTLVQLGKTLHLGTVAEGIEDDEQLAELREEACDLGQGFLLARPLAPEAFDALLEPDQANARPDEASGRRLSTPESVLG